MVILTLINNTPDKIIQRECGNINNRNIITEIKRALLFFNNNINNMTLVDLWKDMLYFVNSGKVKVSTNFIYLLKMIY